MHKILGLFDWTRKSASHVLHNVKGFLNHLLDLKNKGFLIFDLAFDVSWDYTDSIVNIVEVTKSNQ